MANPFSQDAHDHPLAEAYQAGEYLCHGCHTLGVGTSKRCQICNFDLHDYCATCPDEIGSSNIHPSHTIRLVFERANSTQSPDEMRVCDVCGDEVDGLHYHCADCDLDVHPLCHQLPLVVEQQGLHHPNHKLTFARHNDNSATCKVCQEPCEFWWYRCVDTSCASAKVDFHPECLMKVPFGEGANGERGLRPRPTQQQQQQQQTPGNPMAEPTPAASFLPDDDNRLYNDYQKFLLVHQQQPYYPPPQLYDPSCPPTTTLLPPYAYPYPPYPPTPDMHTQYGQRPAHNAFGNAFSPHPQGIGYPGGDENPNGKKRRRMYVLVGKLLFGSAPLH